MALNMNDPEAVLALHALRFYISAKGQEASDKERSLVAKFAQYLEIPIDDLPEVESVASLLGARGGTIGGASMSEAKRSASAANGAKGGRPRKPNLFIKFAKAVWQQPDPKLWKALNLAVGRTNWLPDEHGDEIQGPYVRVHVPEITPALQKMLSNSLMVFAWDDKPFLRLCAVHKKEPAREITEDESRQSSVCEYCSKSARWIY